MRLRCAKNVPEVPALAWPNVAGLKCPTSPPVPNTTRWPGLHARDKSRASLCTTLTRCRYWQRSCQSREYIFVFPRCYSVYRVVQRACVQRTNTVYRLARNGGERRKGRVNLLLGLRRRCRVKFASFTVLSTSS